MFVLRSMPSILHESRQSPTFSSVEEFRQKRRSTETKTTTMRSPAANRGSRIRAQPLGLTPSPLPERKRVQPWSSGIEGKAPVAAELQQAEVLPPTIVHALPAHLSGVNSRLLFTRRSAAAGASAHDGCFPILFPRS